MALAVFCLDPVLLDPGRVGAYRMLCLGGAADDKAEFALIHRALYGISDPVAIRVRHRVLAQGELFRTADFFAGNIQLGGSSWRPVIQEIPVLVYPQAAAIQDQHRPDAEGG